MLPQAARIGMALGAATGVLVIAVVGSTLAAADTPDDLPTSATAAPTPTPSLPVAPGGSPSPEPSGSASPAPSTPPVAPSDRLPLRAGAVGPRVAAAQERLAWLGHEVSDANRAGQRYGASTQRAVKDFQTKNWLKPTGKIDKRTWRKLTRLAEPVGVLPRRCTEKSKAICIDKTTRLIRYVVKGKVKMIADARFGAPGMETGEGVFAVHEKSYNHVSSKYHSWMPRAMFFNRDEAVHYSPDFVSVGYARGSHGCVGLRDMEKATWLFNQVPVGTRVYVYWS